MKTYYVFILLLNYSFISYSQNINESDLDPYFNAIVVENLDSSIDWYVHNLGYKLENKLDMEERGFKQANLSTGKSHLELIWLSSVIYPKAILRDQPPRTKMAGLFKLGFRVSRFDDWIETFTSNEVKLLGNIVNDPITKKRMVIILDPDGNRIQIFEK